MEIPMFSRLPTTNATPTTSVYCCNKLVVGLPDIYNKRRNATGRRMRVRAGVERNGGDGIDATERKNAGAGAGVGVGAGAGAGAGSGFSGSTMEVTTFNQSFPDTEFPVWDKIGAVVRLSYGIG
ncbi:hypothetical protein Hanom_Chr03g00260901 [Helianthus anomalus]